MKETIVEGNKIIAEFMGKKFKPYKGNSFYDEEFSTYAECQKWIEDNCLEKEYEPELDWKIGLGKYHLSWDWLMPVVGKIERIKGVHCEISELSCDIYSFGKHISNCKEETKLLTVWQSVVQFITWYNEHKK